MTGPCGAAVGEDTDTEVELHVQGPTGLQRISAEALTRVASPRPSSPLRLVSQSEPPSPTASSQALLNYRLYRRLARRTSTVLFEAVHLHLSRRVVIEFLDPALRSDERAVLRFLAEARAMAAVSHPRVPTVHDFGQDASGNAYLVREHAGGEPLSQRLARGPIAFGQALDLAAQIADVLAAVHDSGLVYTDLGPERVLVIPRSRSTPAAALVDFAAAAAESVPSSLAERAQRLAALRYLAPEQTVSNPASPASDVYGLGCLLVELVTGAPPPTGDTAAALGGLRAPIPDLLEHFLARRSARRPSALVASRWLRAAARAHSRTVGRS